MNRQCHGRYYVPLKMYRCLLDGKLITLNEIPTVCPNCNRETFVSEESIHKLVKIRKVIIEEIELNDTGAFIEVSREETPCKTIGWNDDK